jgi:hypothetical protein
MEPVSSPILGRVDPRFASYLRIEQLEQSLMVGRSIPARGGGNGSCQRHVPE